MLAVLPLQGFAAALQASCGPSQEQVMSHAAAMSEHHDMMMAHAEELKDGAQHKHAGSADKKHQHENSICSACAACCVGASVLPTGFTLPSAAIAADVFFVYPTAIGAGITLAGLERPPKRYNA
jgi:hypothetical protein